MIVGYMRNYKKPPQIAKLVAIISKFKGIDLVYFNHKKVDMKNNKINGQLLLGDEWVDVKVDIPKVIDVSPFCHKHRKVIRYLRRKSYLTDDSKNRLSKERLQDALAKDKKFAKHIIATTHLKSYRSLMSFIKKHKEVVVKPVYSRRGQGVYIIKRQKKDYLIGYQQEEKVVSANELKELFNNKFAEKRHIVQKYVESRNENGDPFDCRIHLEKNGKGDWEVVKIISRIGIGQKVIANVNYGGGRAEIIPFLKMNYRDNWEEIHTNLEVLGLSLANKIEEIRETSLMTMGLDIGIDKEGKLYIFEANSAPSTTVIKADVAMVRTDYYKYLLKKYG